MNDHLDDCDGECEMDEGYLDARFSPWDLMVALMIFLHGVGQAFANAAEVTLKASIAASNRGMRQQDFAEQVSREIETIPVTGETSG